MTAVDRKAAATNLIFVSRQRRMPRHVSSMSGHDMSVELRRYKQGASPIEEAPNERRVVSTRNFQEHLF